VGTAGCESAWSGEGTPSSARQFNSDLLSQDTRLDRFAIEEDTVHPQLIVGKRFPDLELPDHRGETVRLSKLAGEYPLIVSFYRGYW